MHPVVVVGGGIVGLCAAYALRRRGLDVVVVAGRNRSRGAASHGNGGWICPALSDPLPAPGLTPTALRWLLRPDSPFYIAPRPDPAFLRWLWAFWRRCNRRDYRHGLDALAHLNARTMTLYDAMAADGVAFEMHCNGLLFLFHDEASAQAKMHELHYLGKFGYAAARWLDSSALRQEEPNVSERVAAGVLAPAERHVRPDSLVRGLLHRLTEMGVQVRTDDVTDVVREHGRVVGVRAAAEELPASHLVLAAGIWTARLARLVGARIPLEAGKGYSVTMSPPPLPIRRPLYLGDTYVGCSPYEGALRILGTMELSGINAALTPRRLASLKAAPAAYLRDWTVTNVREEWTGLRPLTPDGLPIIGAVPGAENVVIAAGHAMLGVTLGPVTGEAVADIITGQPDAQLLAPFRVDRF